MHGKTIDAILYIAKRGEISVSELAREINTSYSNAYRILQELKKYGIVYEVDGKYRMDKILAMIINSLASRYNIKTLFRRSSLKILCSILEARSLQEIVSITELSEATVRNSLNQLLRRGLIERKGNKYEVINDPAIRALLSMLQNLLLGVEEYATVLYRDALVVIKSVLKGKRAKGSLTAFSVFPRYGFRYDSPYDYYVYPKQEVKIEDAIVHALIAATSRYEATIVALFYAKNYDNIDKERLKKLAIRYKVLHLIMEMDKYLAGATSTFFLPYSELERLAQLYNINLSKFREKIFSERILKDIGRALSKDAKVFLIGGGAMVLKGYKGTTVDVDLIALSDEDFNELNSTLIELGFRKHKGKWWIFERPDIRIDLYNKRIPNSFTITKSAIKRAKAKKYGRLTVYIPADEDIFLMKAVSSRPKDMEDLEILLRRGDISWRDFIKEVETQDSELEEPISHKVLWAIQELEDKLGVKIPYKRKLKSIVLKNVVPYLAKHGLTVKEISKMLGFPEAVIRRSLSKSKKREEV